eukprot:416841-Rhodomonas_salina.3
MSTTYEKISQESMLQWGLVRATIIISIDHVRFRLRAAQLAPRQYRPAQSHAGRCAQDMGKAQRLSDACRYFEWENNDISVRPALPPASAQQCDLLSRSCHFTCMSGCTGSAPKCCVT